jgi:signal transduction histidine kinase
VQVNGHPSGKRWREAISRLRSPFARIALLLISLGMIGLISWLDWRSGAGREPADLYEIPILISAITFGVPGVLFSATFCSFAYLASLWYHRVPYSYVDLTEVLLFYVLGLMAAQLISEYLRACEARKGLHALNAQLEQRISEALAAERKAQQRLREGQRLTLLGEAAAQIAHEIKNPLVSIGGFAYRLQRQIDPSHPAQKGLQIIVREVARLEIMLRELLDFASPGSREKNVIAVAALIGEVLTLAQPPAQECGVQIVFIPPGDSPSLLGDRDQLKRALLNVVLNGVQAMPDGGTLTVAVSLTRVEGAPNVNIAVSDTGSGIAPGHMKRIFEPFFTTKKGGTGLGLALAKKTTEAHGGSLQVESSPRSGTTVTLSLPAQAHPPADRA